MVLNESNVSVIAPKKSATVNVQLSAGNYIVAVTGSSSIGTASSSIPISVKG